MRHAPSRSTSTNVNAFRKTSRSPVTVLPAPLKVPVATGLLFRTALRSLTTFPATQVGQVLGLLVSGLLLTPLVPFGLARIAAVAPLTRDLAQTLGYPARGRAFATGRP